MNSRSASSSTFTSSTSSISTTATSTSFDSTSRPSPPPRYSAHFTHLSPCSTPVDTSKLLPPSPTHHQEEPQPKDLQQQQQQQTPRWTPLSSHGLPRTPVPGQMLHRSRARQARTSSVSELPATTTTSEPVDTRSMNASSECERSRASRSQSRPAMRNPYAQQDYAPGHRQTQSLGESIHCQHNHDCHHQNNHHHHSTAAAAAERHRQEEAGTTNDADAASGSRESSGSTSKFKQLRNKVATSCAGWRERERERRRLAAEDVVEVGKGGHWSEY